MSDTNGPQAETTTTERKPPTLADIVREKTDDGRRIIDFFLDVMEDRIDGAELCHRIDTAKQLVKYGSKDAARFIARYRGVSCGHSTRGRRDPADPCSTADASPAAGPLNAPGPFTQDLLTVLSGVDEDLMARLVRAQTADGGTVIEFLDDVMQDRTEGFKCHHRIAAAKELIVHIVRDEAPEPEPVEGSVHPEPVEGPVLSTVEGSAHPEPNSIVVPAEAGTHPAPNSTVVPAKSLAPEQSGAGTHPLNPEPVLSTVGEPVLSLPKGPAEGPTSVHPELVEGPDPEHQDNPTSVHPEPQTEGPPFTLSLSKGQTPNTRTPPEPTEPTRRRRTRKQRRQHGAARAATPRKGVRAQQQRRAGQAHPRGAHHRRAQNQGKTRTALARTGPLWRAHRLRLPRPLAPLVDLNPTTQLNSERGRGLLPPLP